MLEISCINVILRYISPRSCRMIRHFRKDTQELKFHWGESSCGEFFFKWVDLSWSGEFKFFINFLTDRSKAMLLFYTLLDVYVSCLSVRLSDLFLAAFWTSAWNGLTSVMFSCVFVTLPFGALGL